MNPSTPNTPQVKYYDDNWIVQMLELEYFDEAFRKSTLREIKETTNDAVLGWYQQRLDAATVLQYNELTKHDPAQALTYLAQFVPNLEPVVQQLLERSIEALLEAEAAIYNQNKTSKQP